MSNHPSPITHQPSSPASGGNIHKGVLRIPGDIVNQATADLPDDQRSLLRWFHSHAAERNLSLTEAAAEIRYNENTLYQVWTGRHQAGKDNICDAISKYRDLAQARTGLDKLGFIETALTKKIYTLCQAALTYQRIAFIFGDSQTGKTTALREYARTHNHGETIYMSTPTGGGFTAFLAELALALRISPRQRIQELRARIMQAFDNRMLLVVDEAHQIFASVGPRTESMRHTQALEFIREVHDRSGCGVVISATNIFREELETGKTAGILAQLKRRRLAALQLPAAPTKSDLTAFAAAYGLPPAEGDALQLQTDMIRAEALGMWLTLLRMASKKATERAAPLTWPDVIRARHQLAKLEA